MRRAAQVDANHRDIVDALRDVGCSVESLAGVGDGVPDLLVGFCKQTFLLEVKDGTKKPSAQKLRESQVDWHAEWKGRPVIVVRSVAEALKAVGVVR